MHLRDLATAWVRSNCPRPELQANFLQHFDQVADRGVTCSFTVGHELTRSGKSYLLYCYSGELFEFELTSEQSARLQVADNMLLCAEGLRQHPVDPKTDPLAWIKGVSVDNADAFDPMLPIAGSLRCRTTQLLHDPLAIRVSCEPLGRGSGYLYHHLLALRPPEGTVRFTLMPIGPLHDRDRLPFVGALPLFFEIVITPAP